MNTGPKLSLAGLLMMLVATQSCMAVGRVDGNPAFTMAASTPTGTSGPRATMLPVRPPTRTPVAEEVRSSVLEMHKLVVTIQFNAEVTAELARGAIAGALPPSDVPQSVIQVSGLADAVEWIVPFIVPEARLEAQWSAALAVHRHTRQLLGRWAKGSATPRQVLQELDQDLASIGRTVDEVEAILATDYGIEMKSLVDARNEALAGIRGVLEPSATPP